MLRVCSRRLAADISIAKRYAEAAFAAAKEANALDQVYSDLSTFRDLLQDENFKLLIESPGIKATERAGALRDIGSKVKASALTMNFIDLLIENKRVGELKSITEIFEADFRKHKGQIVCVVSTAEGLNAKDKERIQKALQTRAGKGKELIVDFDVNPSITGGLLVKMGDAIFDFTVASKIERLQTELLKSVE